MKLRIYWPGVWLLSIVPLYWLALAALIYWVRHG